MKLPTGGNHDQAARYGSPLQRHDRLPTKAWPWVLRADVAAGHFPAVAPGAAPTLTNKPSVLIDRATRGSDGWNDASLQYREPFEDGLTLNSYEENIGTDILRQQAVHYHQGSALR
ncbi:hypothetical protein [Deinococcus sp. QL22]|uniref:hypothetical protein n=1 Tax=Deinococcus sp. QL22 TaxID=2939437 RepID=UPI002017C777|nr:hypothetical protein [Deinococcus sp. QL22]UQN08415.1 hypothetical protein M1R55_16960 [Deinococcus sp. QL22]